MSVPISYADFWALVATGRVPVPVLDSKICGRTCVLVSVGLATV
jgi:hypothetical protein